MAVAVRFACELALAKNSATKTNTINVKINETTMTTARVQPILASNCLLGPPVSVYPDANKRAPATVVQRPSGA